MSVLQAAKNCWKAHCKAAERKTKACKRSPYHRGVKLLFDLWWLNISRQDITEALDITSEEEPDEDTRNLRKSKQARKEDQRLYEQEQRSRQQEEEEGIRVQEERKRLAREQRKRNQEVRNAAKKRKKKRLASEAMMRDESERASTSKKQRVIRDGQVYYSKIASVIILNNPKYS
jgi:hypothetical protein